MYPVLSLVVLLKCQLPKCAVFESQRMVCTANLVDRASILPQLSMAKRLRYDAASIESPIRLNVGGKIFDVSMEMMNSFQYLQVRLGQNFRPSVDVTGELFVDRCPNFFEVLLQRVHSLTRPRQSYIMERRRDLLSECDFYGVSDWLQNAAAAAGDDDYCFPIYQPCAQKMPLEAQLVQLCCEASRLRCQLAGVDAQIVQLTAAVQLPRLGYWTPFVAASFGLESGSSSGQIALVTITRRKVINKKVVMETPGEKLAAKCMPFGKDDFVKSDLANDLGRRLIEQRADAYEHGEGRNDSGSTSSEGDSDSDFEDDDVCIVCGEERTLVTCPSGCGCFCQWCYEAHVEDGRHWTL